jgi:hypothetical protein
MSVRLCAAAIAALQIAALLLPAGGNGTDLNLERLHAATHAAAPVDRPCPFHVQAEGEARALPRWAHACPCGCGSDVPATLQEHGLDLVLPPSALAAVPATRPPVASEPGLRPVEPRLQGVDHVPIPFLG